MSLEIFPTIQKDSLKGKDSGTTAADESKKEKPSLFDSLLKSATQQPSQTATQKEDAKTTVATTQEQNRKTEPTKTAEENSINVKNLSKEDSKNIADKLVDMVVDKVKSNTQKGEKTELETDTNRQNKVSKEESKLESKLEIKSENKVENKLEIKGETKTQEISSKTAVSLEDTKKIVETKSDEIKESVSDIKKELSKLTTSDEQNSTIKNQNEASKKEINTEIKSDSKIQNIAETTKVVETKSDIIKEAVLDIKTEVSKLTSKEIGEELKKEIKTENSSSKTKEKVETTLENTTKVVQTKSDIINEAVSDIDNAVSKLTSDEEQKNIIKNKNTTAQIENTIVRTTNIDDIKKAVELKSNSIKEAVSDIKKEVGKLTTTDEQTTLKPEIKNENKQTVLSKSQNSINQDIEITNTIVSLDTKNIDSKSPVMASMFLNAQRKQAETTSMEQVLNAKKNIEENKNLSSVKQSANMLDLNAKEIEVKHTGSKGESKSELFAQQAKENQMNFSQESSLNKIIINKQHLQDYTLEQSVKNLEKTIQIEKEADKTQDKEKNVTVNVPQTVVETIQSKIIGAQQKVGSFMSEVARNMYLNYKPPVTAFKINLNPANLGSIAVVMKASKADNTISVSLNMNNSSTMEAFVENKVALQTALQRQIGENSNVTLNFDMQGDNSNNNFEQSNQNNSNDQAQEDSQNTQGVSDIEESEEEVKNSDYM